MTDSYLFICRRNAFLLVESDQNVQPSLAGSELSGSPLRAHHLPLPAGDLLDVCSPAQHQQVDLLLDAHFFLFQNDDSHWLWKPVHNVG